MSINPIRYPGGKGSNKIKDRILSLYPSGYFDNKQWIEPFCGGCGLGLRLLENDIIDTAIFNDYDVRIYDMWCALSYDTKRFIDKMNGLNINLELFHKAKTIANDDTEDSFNRGFYTFCLNRMCRSGYIDGGVIGGKEQNGKYKCDSRFNKTTLEKKIKTISKFAKEKRIKFSNYEAIEMIANNTGFSEFNRKNVFLYIDPPYYKKGTACYKVSVDHNRLADVLLYRNTDINWLLSYDDCYEIKELYKDCKIEDLEIVYSNNTKTRGKTNELLILPYL